MDTTKLNLLFQTEVLRLYALNRKVDSNILSRIAIGNICSKEPEFYQVLTLNSFKNLMVKLSKGTFVKLPPESACKEFYSFTIPIINSIKFSKEFLIPEFEEHNACIN